MQDGPQTKTVIRRVKVLFHSTYRGEKKQLPSYKAIYRGYFKTILGAHPVSLYPYEKTIKSSGRGPEQCGNFAKNNIFNQSIDIPKDPDMP